MGLSWHSRGLFRSSQRTLETLRGLGGGRKRADAQLGGPKEVRQLGGLMLVGGLTK